MKTIYNLTAKSTKDAKRIANNKQKSFNQAIKVVLAVWDGTNKANKIGLTDDERAIIKDLKIACKADGVNRDDFSAKYIITHLEGTNYVQNAVIGYLKKDKTTGEKVFTKRELWTAGQLIDYVRRASRAHLIAQRKALKEAK